MLFALLGLLQLTLGLLQFLLKHFIFIFQLLNCLIVSTFKFLTRFSFLPLFFFLSELGSETLDLVFELSDSGFFLVFLDLGTGRSVAIHVENLADLIDLLLGLGLA